MADVNAFLLTPNLGENSRQKSVLVLWWLQIVIATLPFASATLSDLIDGAGVGASETGGELALYPEAAPQQAPT